MSPRKSHDKLDERIRQAIGRDDLSFDPQAWQAKYSEEIREVWARAASAGRRTGTDRSIWRTIMNSRLTRGAAAAMLLIAVLVGVHFIGSNSGSAAFAKAVEYLSTRRYAFEITFEIPGSEQGAYTMQAAVREDGRFRLDYNVGLGPMSSVSDLGSGKTLLLFHRNQSAVLMEEPELKPNTGADGVFTLFTRPVEELWNLRDGTEESLGEKEIDGQGVMGFRVVQQDDYFTYEITVWATSREGTPVRVELDAAPRDAAYPAIQWTASEFNLEVPLDDSLFDMNPPDGYTLAYQESLEDTAGTEESSAEARKVQQVLSLWAEGQRDQAMETLLEIDWEGPFVFGTEFYLCRFSEQDYIAIKMDDQQQVMERVMKDAAVIKQIAREAVERSRAAAATGDHPTAERYGRAILNLGQLLNDPERMLIVRLVGIAAEKISLDALIELYEATGNQEALKQMQTRRGQVNAQTEAIKREASGR